MGRLYPCPDSIRWAGRPGNPRSPVPASQSFRPHGCRVAGPDFDMMVGMKATIYDGWDKILAERFPNYDSRERDTEWAQVKQKFTIGQSISGAVIARAEFGAWVELGIEFPALISIIC